MLGVVRPERRAAARERLFEQVLRLVVHAEAPVHPADDGEDLGLRIGLVGELLLHPLGCRVEEPADRESVRTRAIRDRIGAGQQPAERLADLGRLRRLALRAVALGREPVRVKAVTPRDDDDARRRRRDAAACRWTNRAARYHGVSARALIGSCCR